MACSSHLPLSAAAPPSARGASRASRGALRGRAPHERSLSSTRWERVRVSYERSLGISPRAPDERRARAEGREERERGRPASCVGQVRACTSTARRRKCYLKRNASRVLISKRCHFRRVLLPRALPPRSRAQPWRQPASRQPTRTSSSSCRRSRGTTTVARSSRWTRLPPRGSSPPPETTTRSASGASRVRASSRSCKRSLECTQRCADGVRGGAGLRV